jgi:hypothetical protein
VGSLSFLPSSDAFQLVQWNPYNQPGIGPKIKKAFFEYGGNTNLLFYGDNIQSKNNPLFYITKITGVRSPITGKVYRSPIEKMMDLYGMTWIEFRRKLYNVYLDPSNDQRLIDHVYEIIKHRVPVRSGFLLDILYKETKIFRKVVKGSLNRFWFGMKTVWPRIWRPWPIKGRVQHTPPETGYGLPYIPTSKIVSNSTLLYITKGGYALYQLNDPAAHNDPLVDIQNEFKSTFANYYGNIFREMEVELRLPGTEGVPDTAKILYGIRPQSGKEWASS